jgi:tetratricopeptide (TPR) repeat protein
VRSIFETGLLAAALAVSTHAHAATDPLAEANAALQAGEADQALQLLSSHPPSAEVHNLSCRVQLTLEHWDVASRECEQAVNLDGENSGYHMWLGRAIGERAERASFTSAYSLAKRVRTEFEAAVRLNPRNAEALADLGEFYSSAPGIVGGGNDKAEGVAAQLDKVDPARAHELRARMAEARKDYANAEREFKQAIATSQHPAFQWMTLASFYRRREQLSQLDNAVDNGMKSAQRDRHAGVALFDGASELNKANRNPALAARMLEDYLASTSMTEEAPAFVAHTRLARLKAQLGDKAGASRERALALGLAHDYKPAQDLKF